MKNTIVLSSSEVSMHPGYLVGGKAANLAWLTRNGFPVPDWFVITTQGFLRQLARAEILEDVYGKLKGITSDNGSVAPAARYIQDKFSTMTLIPELCKAIEKHLVHFGDLSSASFAVRSSALGEDGMATSFAGQMDSILFQRGADAIMQSVCACFASMFSERSLRYRLHHGMNLMDIRGAVIVQKMIDSDVSGVFFTAHPATGNRQKGLISACYGSGEGVVSGLCNTDEYTVELYGSAVDARINQKEIQVVVDPENGGTKTVPVSPEHQNRGCLRDDQVTALVSMGRSIAEALQYPQDIEWGICRDKLYILQTRPVTSLPAVAQPGDNTIIWDNSNIQESYCGVTTPLTFSFANRAYMVVYKQIYEVLGVPRKKAEAMAPVLQNMLGLIRGRVYYNINNWYRYLCFLPSFKTNKADMERMMGLQDPVDFVGDENPGFIGKCRKLPGMVKSLAILLYNFRRMDSLVNNFRANFEKSYNKINRPLLHTYTITGLMALIRQIHNEVMTSWEAPILNDFNVMMMNGKIHRWLEKIEPDNPTILQNNLLSGEEGIESTEPTKFILRMCDYIRTRPGLKETIIKTDACHLLSAVQTLDTDLYRQCLDYIEKYGDRCIGELKLESITLRHDPSFLFAVIKNYLAREDLTISTLRANEQKLRRQTEAIVFTRIRNHYGKFKLKRFKKDLEKFRQAVKNRENMRLMRTRVFGLVRDIYLEIGTQLAFHGLLEAPRDIFYLTVEELEAYMDGRTVQATFKPLVASRKEEFESYKKQDLPHHFATNGAPYHHNAYDYPGDSDPARPDEAGNQETLHGIGCYPGIVEEKAKLIFSPDDELTLDGQILCTVRTDPGWAPLFPTAGGILVERGSTLSHSAVVARELGIPAIVNIPGLTKRIQDGERIRMDGSKGTIERKP